MTLITNAQTEQLFANGLVQRAAIDRQDKALDFKPVVKLFTPDAQRTWLLTEIDEGTDPSPSAFAISAWTAPDSAT